MKKTYIEGNCPQVMANFSNQATVRLTNEHGLPKVGKIKQAAEDFGIPVHAIRTWVRSGVLPCVLAGKVYLINYEVLAEFLRGQCLPTYENSVPTLRNTGYMPKEPKTMNKKGKHVKVLPPIV